MTVAESLGALGERQFRLLYIGQTLSNLGSALVPIALAFAVLDLTGSATDLGLVLLASRLPQVLVLAGGVVGDRLPRRRVMLASDLVRCVTQATTAVLLAAVLVVVALAPLIAGLAMAAPLPVLAVAAGLGGFQASLSQVLWTTSLQQHVPAQGLARVSAYGWLGALVFAALGYALAGPVSNWIGVATTLWIGAAWVLISTGLVLAVPGIRSNGWLAAGSVSNRLSSSRSASSIGRSRTG